MYLKSLALLVAIYGRGAIAALPNSCEVDGGSCTDCTPINQQFEPPGMGEVWFSQCCNKEETDNATPPNTVTKKYCYSYKLAGWPNNQYYGNKPSTDPDKCGTGNEAWSVQGQCVTSGGAGTGTGAPYTVPTPASGCPGEYDSSTDYAVDDTVEDNAVVYKCTNAAFCDIYEPNLLGVGLLYWTPQGACTGTATPTAAPTYANPNAGCPEEYDSSDTYEPNDKVSVTRPDGVSIIYQCRAFPEGLRCNDNLYSPTSTVKQCNGETCWPEAWNKLGACEGTYTPTVAPTFGSVGGCPEEYDSSVAYEAGDKVSVTPAGEDYGKIYQCKTWPAGGNCVKEAYSPTNTDKGCNGEVCWPEAWTYVGGCYGTIAPTVAPTFGSVGGCPEEYDSSVAYEPEDKVSVTPAGEDYGKIYKCKAWPAGGNCKKEIYSPANTEKQCNGELCWPEAWTYVGGCYGTIAPTVAPTFGSVSGCPEEYDSSATYEAGDTVSVTPAGEDYGKIYKCKTWPDTGRCNDEIYSPTSTQKQCNGELCWPQAWTYEGGCYGTIAPTTSPAFSPANIWDATNGGCPDDYVPNQKYEGGDLVSIPKNVDTNTLGFSRGIVWQCIPGTTSPWCQQEEYAPGTENGNSAWEKMGHCEGTLSPTDAPTTLANNPNPAKQLCQFKKKLASSSNGLPNDGNYIVLQAEDWQYQGSTVSTSGVALELYAAGDLVRYGRDARSCSNYPYTGYCETYTPFPQDTANAQYYNNILSGQGWKDATCEDVVSQINTNGVEDLFVTANNGPVFASNGNVLVDADGDCQTGDATPADSGATNPGDYFVANPTVLPCKQCPTDSAAGAASDRGMGLGSPSAPKVCIDCKAGAADSIVNKESQCVCNNGASNPWAADADHCKTCPSGKRYLGNVDNTAGDGECEACPADKPVYTQVTNSGVTYKLCCKESGCGGTGVGLAADCFDGTTGACAAAGITG